LAEDRRTPEPPAHRPQELDDQVEDLTRRIAEVVNSAGAESRQDLREYAIGLLKEETELTDAAPGSVDSAHAPSFNPLAIALLLVLVSLPLLLSIVFAPVGLAVLALAGLMGLWGVLATVFRRR
jgi:VIT1/CCC1 family predicted Fe2+/Mn2+ transporter